MIELVSTKPPLFYALEDFIATYDRADPEDRQIRWRLLGLLHGELYRRERERYPEYVDLGGEA